MANQDETGHEVEVSVNGETIVKTTTTLDIQPQTSESVMDDSPNPSTTYTYWYAEGTLEWDGSQIEAVDVFYNDDGSPVPKDQVQLRVNTSETVWRFRDVTTSNLNREAPSDGHSSGSIDWKADTYRRE